MALRHGVRGVRVAAARLAGPARAALATGAPHGGGCAAGGLRAFDGPFPAAGGHGGWGGPRWVSMECAASAGSESDSGSELEPSSESASDSESSVAREVVAAGPGEFDRPGGAAAGGAGGVGGARAGPPRGVELGVLRRDLACARWEVAGSISGRQEKGFRLPLRL